MIDTVRFAFDGPVDWTKDVLDGPWREVATAQVRVVCGDIEESSSRLFQHEPSGLRVGGGGAAATWCEVSLPRMIYGDNGIVLKPEDCAASWGRLKALVATAAPGSQFKRLTRIDLVHQFKADPREWIAMLRDIPHPKIRRKCKEWFDSGLTWPGSRVFINLYDKLLEKTGRLQGDIARLEFQIRGRDIPAGLWSAADGFNFSACYQAYRELCLGFVPRPLPAPTGLTQFLSWLDSSAVTIGGVRPLEVWLASKSRRSRYRIKAAVRRSVCPEKRIRFAELLPADHYPEWTDCLVVPEVTENAAVEAIA